METGAGSINGVARTYRQFERLYSGSVDDLLVGSSVANLIDGSEGAGDIFGGGRNDSLYGRVGNDTIHVGEGFDQAFGRSQSDTLDTTARSTNYAVDLTTGTSSIGGESFTGFENLTTGAGDDTLLGTSGASVFYFGAGDDVINEGGAGADEAYGGAGNDTIHATDVNSNAYGGDDFDILDATIYDGDYAIDLTAGTSNFSGIFQGFEGSIAGDGNDSLTGTAGANGIYGGVGDDTIIGGGGGDTLDAGDGNDMVVVADGGLGNFYGGDGIDTLDTSN